ncbi:MMPL family transporter [Demequina zhanjiangensis]|uniref:MMPL family transporter n=1 Tax=Demequina zhanjiangensis TaxID=3051659 RepID=A0ABT8FY22_9MICO|nr:MMPL family transporter [Demequina sp. SYSU T00b26]MDN4471594.1 MMPL family transporter [Demequina sp. SYSU T00b26]
MTTGLTGRLARTSAARPWLTIAVWTLLVAAAVALSGSLGDALVQDDRNLVATESDAAAEIDARERGDAEAPISETIVVHGEPSLSASGLAEAADAAVAAALTVDGVESAAVSPAVSASGTSLLVQVTVAADHPDAAGEELLAATDALTTDGVEFLSFGQLTGEAMFDGLAEDTLMRGEAIGVGVAILILIGVFGALVAAGIPLLVSLVSITTAIGATAVVGAAFDLSFFIVNMITMMGLALGVDYTLVIVQRFREELSHGRTPLEAVGIAGTTANRAVLFSGLTVLVSLAGMLLVPSTIMRSLGAGAMLSAIMAVVTALTLLPAVLRLLGHRVNKGRVPLSRAGREPRAWRGIAHTVTGRPVVALVSGLAVLLALAVPFASMRLAFPGLEALPADNEFRVASEVLVGDFGYGSQSTVIAIEDAADDAATVDELAAWVEDSPAYAETTVDWRGDTVFIDTKDVYGGADERAEEAMLDLRAHVESTGLDAYVGGDQAESLDFASLITDATPWVLLAVLGASFVLLLLAFRSVVIPATAIVLNLLSAAAAYGLMVMVFQWGVGNDLLGMPQTDAIAPWIPLFLFAVLFGLSMDYHVFLLTRIKERHDAGDTTKVAVIHGLSRTGSLITGAALIMVAVFAGFALGDLAEFAQMGFGLAAAVIIDATVVRTILVPSLMTLLGKRNWYLPRALQWLPAMRIEAEPTAAPQEREPALVPATR